MKKTILLTGLLFILLIAPLLDAQEFDRVFPSFLFILVEKNGEMGNLAMPDVEILTIPGEENEALYLLSFNSPEDERLFYTILEKENIPHGTLQEAKPRLMLFHSDLLVFIMQAVIGL